MTVTATTSRISYAGNGSTTTFAVPFYFLANADLVLIKTTSAGVQTTLTLTTDYTVSGAGVLAGGSVTLVTAPGATDTLVIYRDPAVTQAVDYQPNDPFPAETHERALDKLTMITQRLKDLVTRSFRLSDGDTTTASTTLPSPASNKLIGWNSAGTGLQNIDQSTLATIVAFGTSNADVFTGNGTTTAFTLSANPGAQANLDVSVGGVTQTPGTHYNWVSGTTVTFTAAPPNGVTVLIRYFQALPQGTTDSAAATFLQAGANASSRTAQAKLREWVSPEDFGAIGDGVTNDTNALQYALNTGKMVRGTPGANYSITPLTQSTARQVIDMRGCTLTLRPAQSSYMLTLNGQGARVLGGVWDGNKSAGQSTTGAYYDHAAVNIAADYCVVDGIKSQNSAGIGIKGTLCSYTAILNNEVTGWNVHGIFNQCATADAYGNRIEGNTVTVGLNTGVGIYLTGQSASPYTYKQRRWIVARNVVTGPTNPAATDIGITCRAIDGVVANNVVTNCDLGISCDITSRTVITGNRVEFTGTFVTGYCIEANGADNTITGNICKGGNYGVASSGLLARDGNTITGNVFELQANTGVYFASTGSTSNYLTISGNTFNYAGAGAQRLGVRFTGDCRYSTITGNNFIGPGSGVSGGRAVYLDTSYGEVQICNNRFQGWQRPVALYSASAYSYVNVMFNGNDCSKDMVSESAWLSLEGSAAYGTGIKQMFNNTGTSAGYTEINYMDRATNLLFYWAGNGTPEGAVTAGVGSLYMNTAGSNSLYVKQTGTGNTGWVLK